MTRKKDEGASAAPKAADSKLDEFAIITTDEHAGHGGSFILDPVSGVRTKVKNQPTEKE